MYTYIYLLHLWEGGGEEENINSISVAIKVFLPPPQIIGYANHMFFQRALDVRTCTH